MRSAISLLISIPVIILIPLFILSTIHDEPFYTAYCSETFKTNLDKLVGNTPVFTTWCSIFPDVPTIFIMVMALGIITLFIVTFIRHYYLSRL
jgi:hypothetical protein